VEYKQQPTIPRRQGWEHFWAGGPISERYWERPEPTVLAWAERLSPPQWILDLGCGVGRHLVSLSLRGLNVVGGDIAPTGLKICAERLRQQGQTPRLVLHDMAFLPFADCSFDALLAFHVIYHTTLAGLRNILAEIHRILRPGGHLYLTMIARWEENIARYRADVKRGIALEPEPFTFIYLQDAPSDKDILHHYCDEEEVRDLLTAFEIESLIPVRTDYTDRAGVRHTSLHYHIQACRC
jgi:SAM-dependent methyltransferase